MIRNWLMLLLIVIAHVARSFGYPGELTTFEIAAILLLLMISFSLDDILEELRRRN